MAEYIERDAAKNELLSWAVCIYHPEFLLCEDAVQILNSVPAADVASVRPELRKAVDLLHKNYEKALNSSYVRNPIAWALYHTWKKMDENNRRRCK